MNAAASGSPRASIIVPVSQPWGILQPGWHDRIVVLEDTNGDGVADKATTFYQGPEINAALGICVLGQQRDRLAAPPTSTSSPTPRGRRQGAQEGVTFQRHQKAWTTTTASMHVTFGPDGKLLFQFRQCGR